MRTSIVLDLTFGDSGKGVTTSFLASQSERPLVIRFSGGHQCGHTVVHNGHRHIFSNFGSGTLHGAPTYWTKYCTFYPSAVKREYEALQEFHPLLYVDPLCPVTTPFDALHNQKTESKNGHGSCGVGFGSTIARHENYYKLYVQDLYNPIILKAKLDNIIAFYQDVLPDNWEQVRDKYLTDISFVKKVIKTCNPFRIYNNRFDHIIFEGSQGILLDMDFGFFPNVTRSNTTSKNAFEIIKENNLSAPDIYYVTRSYQTRHGNGFMTNEHIPVKLVNNENETNKEHPWQGKFRIGALDLDLINYALQCDAHFNNTTINKYAVITCLDQTGEDEIPVTISGELFSLNIGQIIERIHGCLPTFFLSHSPNSRLQKCTDLLSGLEKK